MNQRAEVLPLNPAMTAVKAIHALLESAGSKGSTAQDLANTAQIPVGTISARLTLLGADETVHVLNPGRRPRIYCLAKFGGHAWVPHVERKPKEGEAIIAPVAEVRVVVSVGKERKSLTYEEAKSLYAQLKPVFLGKA